MSCVEERISLNYHKYIDFVDSENARARREIRQSNQFVKFMIEKEDEKVQKAIKMFLKLGFTAGVMNEHFINENFEEGCKYYDKYVETLVDVDEYVSENFPEGKYLHCINTLNDDRKNYEKLKNINYKKNLIKKYIKNPN